MSHSYFIVPSVTFPETENEPLEDEFPNLRKLGVNDGHHSSVHMGEDGRGGLGLKRRSGQKTPEKTQPQPSLLRQDIKRYEYSTTAGRLYLALTMFSCRSS